MNIYVFDFERKSIFNSTSNTASNHKRVILESRLYFISKNVTISMTGSCNFCFR